MPISISFKCAKIILFDFTLHFSNRNVAFHLLLRFGQFGTVPTLCLQTGLHGIQRALMGFPCVLELLLLLRNSLLNFRADLGDFNLGKFRDCANGNRKIGQWENWTVLEINCH
jgi:hypothetical protein